MLPQHALSHPRASATGSGLSQMSTEVGAKSVFVALAVRTHKSHLNPWLKHSLLQFVVVNRADARDASARVAA